MGSLLSVSPLFTQTLAKMSSSVTAVKYQKLHRLEKELLPGERFHLEREMEKNVKGYRSLRKELTQARQELDQQRRQRNSEIRNSKTIQTKFYKSVVGTRTTKLSGGIYQSNPVAREVFFSDNKSV